MPELPQDTKDKIKTKAIAISAIIENVNTDHRGYLFNEICTQLRKLDQNYTASLFKLASNIYGK